MELGVVSRERWATNCPTMKRVGAIGRNVSYYILRPQLYSFMYDNTTVDLHRSNKILGRFTRVLYTYVDISWCG